MASEKQSPSPEEDPRGLELRPRWPVSDPLTGEALSVFRGKGTEFDELKPYEPGDEVSAIEWNVFARTGDVFCRRDIEERELTVLLLVDLSSSAGFGSGEVQKRETLARCARLLSGAALSSHDQVGLVTFASAKLATVRPGRGRRQRQRIEETLDQIPSADGATDLSEPMQWALARRSRSLIFLLSDFLAPVPLEMDSLAARHDLVAVRVGDPREIGLAPNGLVEVRDPETGENQLLDTSSRRVREAYAEAAGATKQAWEQALSRLGIDCLDLTAGEDPNAPLRTFLRNRRLKR